MKLDPKVCIYCEAIISNPSGKVGVCSECLAGKEQLELIAEALRIAADLTDMTIRKTFLRMPVTDEGKRLRAQLVRQREQLASLEREIS